MNNPLKYILRALFIIAVQVLILNEVNIKQVVNPFLYPLIILMLPFQIGHATLIAIAFVTGLLIDIFTGTLGMHAASLLIVAFLRPGILSILNPKREDINDQPDIASQGFQWMTSYILLFTVLHHIAYFIIEIGSFSHFGLTLLRILISIFFSSLIMLIWSYLFLDKA
jgi:hypothetical protein